MVLTFQLFVQSDKCVDFFEFKNCCWKSFKMCNLGPFGDIFPFYLFLQYLQQRVKALTVKSHWVNSGLIHDKARADGPAAASPPSCCHPTHGMGSFQCCLKECLLPLNLVTTLDRKKIVEQMKKNIICFITVFFRGERLSTTKCKSNSLKPGVHLLKYPNCRGELSSGSA